MSMAVSPVPPAACGQDAPLRALWGPRLCDARYLFGCMVDMESLFDGVAP